MALPKKNPSHPHKVLQTLLGKRIKKPTTVKGKRITLYLPLNVDEQFTALATDNNVSKTIILKALLAAFKELDINEQNRLLFDAIRDR